MKVYYKKYDETFLLKKFNIADVQHVVQTAYKQRKKTDGISFGALSQSLEDYKRALDNDENIFFLSIDNDELCGVGRLIIRGDYGEICNFAVLPQKQGKHIGGGIFCEITSYAKLRGLKFLVSSTAVKATSSVKSHLHSGFMRIGCGPSGKGYWSYGFRKQIEPHWFWSKKWYCYLRLLLSFLKNYSFNMIRIKDHEQY